MAYVREIAPSAARTSSGEGALVDTLSGGQLTGDTRFYLSVSAVTGTDPTLDVDITATVGGVDYVLGSFTQATGETTESIEVSSCPVEVKAEWVIGGTATPTFTFQVHSTR